VGIPGLAPLPVSQMLIIFVYAMVACLVVNDALKVALIKWRVPNAVAKKPEAKTEPKPDNKDRTSVDLTARVAQRAYELYEKRGRQDGQAVQDWSQAEQEIRKDASIDRTTQRGEPAERMSMNINSKDFRVRADKKVKLKKWPTLVEPYYQLKAQYQEILVGIYSETKRQAKPAICIQPIFTAVDISGHGR